MTFLFDAITRFVALRFGMAAPGRPRPTQIMYWATDRPPQLYEGKARGVPTGDFLLAINVLRSGEPVESYLGWADCRICGERLGTRDMGRFGFVWPERAEHYLEAHDVWAPGLDDLVALARSRGPGTRA